ncbi:hypothetical protein BGX26_004381 [Mortierella sp. AD094]|nr:hypothetical protein BGX26_004381 [Mortierella sp. AD094]
MATPEDSNVLRQLIGQIEGELSTFNGVSGGGSDQSLASFATSQGSLAPSEGSLSGSSIPSIANEHLPQHQQSPYPLPQQQHSFPTTATSAIFGNAFDRPATQPQQSHHQPGFGTTSLIMNNSHFQGPRAPQYIPSPLASPVSPNYTEKNILDSDLEGGQSSNDSLSATERSRAKSLQSQGSLSSVAADLAQDDRQDNIAKADSLIEERTKEQEVDYETTVHWSSADQETNQDHPCDDGIKVDVTELYENFGQKPSLVGQDVMDPEEVVEEEERIRYAGGLIQPENTSQGSSLSLKLPELSFSNNDLISLWSPTTGSAPESLGVDGTEKRTRLHTFHGHSEASQEKDQLAASSLGSSAASSLRMSVAFPPKQPSPLKAGYLSSQDSRQDLPAIEEAATVVISDENSDATVIEAGGPSDELANLKNHARSDRKRLSLVTSGAGLAAAVAAAGSRAQLATNQGDSADTKSELGRSVLDLPTWDLAPLSPPVEVVETVSASAAASPMSVRRGSMIQTQHDSLAVENQHLNGIMSPSSATILTPTTPLTTREARILAGREALLRMSPDKQRVQRGISASSTSSSIASVEKPGSTTSSGDGNDTETLTDPLEASRRASIKSQNSQQSQQIHEGVYGAVPERGRLTDVQPEKLVFPDQSIRPVPLKAYKVRKLTLRERNQTYAQACQEFTHARTGLDVWALRCMMQDRPGLMKDPPAIVKAVAGKYTSGSTHQNSDTQSKASSASGRMTPTAPHFSNPMASSISGAHGIGAMIKSASKRLSIDASSPQASIPEITGQGSFFYKQKTTKSAVELGSWSSGRARGISNNASVAAGIPPPPQGSNGHRNSITGSGEGMVSSSPIQQQQQHLRGGLTNSPSTGSSFVSQNKRNSIAAINSPLSNTLRSRTKSDVQAGSRLSMIGRDSSMARVNSGNSSTPHQHQQRDAAISPVPISAGGNSGQSSFSSSSYTGAPISATSSVFLERPIKRSMSSHYTRRPASMVAASSSQRPGLAGSAANSSTSTVSAGSQSSTSLGSVSSNSIAESADLKTPTTTSSLPSGLKQQQVQQAQNPLQDNSTVSFPSTDNSGAIQPAYAYSSNGVPIPYADETKSKDEVYSPLTSPIMIPIGGFPVSKPSHINSYQNNGGWSSPLSAGGGLTRPLTYAGPSSSSNSSLVMSPSSATREYSQLPQQQQQFGQGVSNLERGNSAGSQEPVKDKTEKSNRYSTSSFSSIGSFAMYQKRSSKKDRKKELLEQQQQQKQQAIDQRYSVSAVNQPPASANEYLTEQSLDKLSDVLPHVDRDRLSIYLQRAYGDEMVAIGLAMSDFRSGQL